jgi:hypothetical protein
MSETETVPQPDPIGILYIGECPSVSGRSTLTYAVGKHEAEGTLHLRIADNTGKGMWCKDWAPAQAIEAIVASAQELTAKSFQGLHPGKSINTGGFVLAALRDLGLIRPCEPNTRVHEHVAKATLERAVTERLNAETGGAAANPAQKARRKAKEAA